MTVWFVSRHPGALVWARSHGVHADRVVPHLEVAQVNSGDVVVGTLPVNLAAEVCAQGAQYWHLRLDLPAEQRGRELAAEELDAFGAGLARYEVRFLEAK